MSDKNKKELIKKVENLVYGRFGGDYGAAFRHYAQKRTADGAVNADELRELLADANVGNGVTRGAWVSGIMREIDRDMDGKISPDEFQSVIEGG